MSGTPGVLGNEIGSPTRRLTPASPPSSAMFSARPGAQPTSRRNHLFQSGQAGFISSAVFSEQLSDARRVSEILKVGPAQRPVLPSSAGFRGSTPDDGPFRAKTVELFDADFTMPMLGLGNRFGA